MGAKVGAKQRTGLAFYEVPLNFPYDPKFSKAEEFLRRKGGNSTQCLIIDKVANRLLSYIYRIGYYTVWSEDMISEIGSGLLVYNIFSEDIALIIHCLIEAEWINKELFNKHNILTSGLIQNHWERAQKRQGRIGRVDAEFYCISSKEIANSSQEIRVSSHRKDSDHVAGRTMHSKEMANSSKVIAIPSEELKNTSEEISVQSKLSDNRSSSINTSTTSTSPERDFSKKTEEVKNTGSPPFRPAPPSKNLIRPEPTELLLPERLNELYFGLDELAATRAGVIKAVKFPAGQDEDLLLHEWGRIFTTWLVAAKGNKPKTLDDFVTHFFGWIIMIDVKQDPTQFYDAKSIKQIRSKTKKSSPHGSEQTKQTTATRGGNDKLGNSGF